MSKRISWCHCHVPLWFFRATLTCQIWHTFDTPGPAPLGAEIWNLARTSHWMISGFWMSSVLANASEVWWKAHTAWTASVFVMGIGKLDGNGASKTYCPELKLLKVWKGAGHRSSGILNMVQKLHNTWDFHWFHMISYDFMLSHAGMICVTWLSGQILSWSQTSRCVQCWDLFLRSTQHFSTLA